MLFPLLMCNFSVAGVIRVRRLLLFAAVIAVTAAVIAAGMLAVPGVVVMVAVRGRVERKLSVRESARRFVGVSRYARVYRYPRFRERGKRSAAYSSAYQRFRARAPRGIPQARRDPVPFVGTVCTEVILPPSMSYILKASVCPKCPNTLPLS